MAGSAVFQLSVETRLHFSLLKKHFLPDLVDGFLVLNGHGVGDSPDLLASLAQIALELLAFPLHLAELSLQVLVQQCVFTVSSRRLFQLGRQVFLKQLVIGFAE